jgi:hypothetical protein
MPALMQKRGCFGNPFFILYLGLVPALRPVIKHTATVFLLLIMAAPMFYSQTMEWRRSRIRKEMKESLKHDLLTSITLSKTDIHWYKPGKEIIVSDHLFDVEGQEILRDGRIRFTGLFDTKETVLHQQLNKHQKDQDQKNNRQLTQFFTDWHALPISTVEHFASLFSRQQPFIHPEMEPVSAFSAILKPPPQA